MDPPRTDSPGALVRAGGPAISLSWLDAFRRAGAGPPSPLLLAARVPALVDALADTLDGDEGAWPRAVREAIGSARGLPAGADEVSRLKAELARLQEAVQARCAREVSGWRPEHAARVRRCFEEAEREVSALRPEAGDPAGTGVASAPPTLPQLFRRIVEGTHEGVWLIDRDARTAYVNRRMAAQLGYTVEEMIGAPVFDFMDEEGRRITERNVERRRQGIEEQHEFHFRRKDGSFTWSLLETNPFFDERGQYEGALAMVSDIGALKKSEQTQSFLADAGRMLSELLDPDQIWNRLTALTTPRIADFCLVHLAGGPVGLRRVTIAAVDPAKVELAEELTRRYPARLEDPYGPGRVVRTGQPELHPQIPHEVLKSVARDDRNLELLEALNLQSGMIVPLRARGAVIGALTVGMAESGRRFDDTDLKMAEGLAERAALAAENARLYAEAQRAVRMREEILGLVSHDLRGLLTTIKLSAQHLDQRLSSLAGGPERAALRLILKATLRSERLIGDLLDFASIQAGRLRLERASGRVDALLEESAHQFEPLFRRRGVGLVTDLSTGVAEAFCDRERILQVLSNLLGNALKFAPEGSEVRLRTEVQGDRLVVTVTDRGPGVAGEVLGRLFQPYAAARANGRKGTGLGLFISRAIVEAHGGRIWVDTVSGAGSTFGFSLPLSQAREVSPQPGAP